MSFINRAYQFVFNRIPMATYMSGAVTFGASGAVASISGSNIKAVTKLTTGLYALQLTSNVNALIALHATLLSPVTGSDVPDGSFTATTLYQITAVGTTDWHAIGLDASLTPSVGQAFVATGVGGSGSGTAKAVTVTGLTNIEVAQNAQASLLGSGPGSIFILQCLNGGTLASPASGSKIRVDLMCRMSSLNQE